MNRWKLSILIAMVIGFSNGQSKTTLKSDLSAKLNDYTNLAITFPAEVSTVNISNDPFIYPFEKVEIIVSGVVNLSPCDIQKKTTGTFGFGRKRYTKRINNHRSAAQLNNGIKLNIDAAILSFKTFQKSKLKSNSYSPHSSESNFGQSLPLRGYIEKNIVPACNEVQIQHEGKLDLEIIVYSQGRFEEFKKLLENQDLKLTVKLLDSWLNPRLRARYTKQIASVIESSVENSTKYTVIEKIKILEYINRELVSNNFNVNKKLGSLYVQNEDFGDAIKTSKTAIDILKNEENSYLLESIYYANELASTYENLAISLVEKELRMNEVELYRASESYGQAATYYIKAFQYQKAYQCKLRQVSILKRINSINSLINAHNIVSTSIGTIDEKGPFYNLSPDDEIDLKSWKYLIIEETIESAFTYQFSSDSLKCKNQDKKCLLNIHYDEIIIKSKNNVVFINNDIDSLEVNIQAKRFVFGQNITIKSSIQDFEYEVMKPPAPQSSYGEKGIKGNPGEHGKDNTTMIKLEGNLYAVNGLTIDLSGGNGQNGQPGGIGGPGRYNSSILTIPPGVGGKGGDGGNGGKGGEIAIDFNNNTKLKPKEIVKSIIIITKGGQSGKRGAGGKGGAYKDKYNKVFSARDGSVGEKDGLEGQNGSSKQIIDGEKYN